MEGRWSATAHPAAVAVRQRAAGSSRPELLRADPLAADHRVGRGAPRRWTQPRASRLGERLGASGLTRTLYYAHARVSAAAPRSLRRGADESPPRRRLRRLVPCAYKRTDDGLMFRDGQLLQTP